MNHHNHNLRNVFAIECGSKKKSFFLDKNLYSLGRTSSNSLFCYHRLISRHHASLIKIKYHSLTNEKNVFYSFWLIDGDLTGKRSTNGVYVNGKKCLNHQLQPGDLIFFGGLDIKGKYDILNLETRSFYSTYSKDLDISLDNYYHPRQREELKIIDASQLEILQLSSDLILLIDVNTQKIISANNYACDLLGYSPKEIQEKYLRDFDRLDQTIIDYELASLQKYHIASGRESIYQNKNQEYINVLVKSELVNYNKQNCILLRIQNINDSHRFAYLLRYQRYHDILNNLPNKRLFQKQLSYCLGAKKNHITPLTVIQIKFIYDNKPLHDVTKKIEQKLEKILINNLKKELSNMDSLGKINNYEYYILLVENKHVERGEILIDNLLEFLQKPIIIEAKEFHITPIFGISHAPDNGTSVEDLLYYSASNLDQYQQQFFQDKLVNINLSLNQEKNTLSSPIDYSQCYLQYQPIINIKNKQIIGFTTELFNQLSQEQYNLVNYSKYLTQSDELINFYRQQITNDLTLWTGKSNSTLTHYLSSFKNISFKVLLSSLQQENNIHSLITLIEENQTSIPNLTIEIIDDCFLLNNSAEYFDKCVHNLSKISSDLILNLSNFSLEQIINLLEQEIVFTGIKIPKIFTHHLEEHTLKFSLVANILASAKSLELSVIAEGIHSEKQQEILSNLGCEIMQGSLFSPPLLPEELIVYCQNY